MANLPYHLEYLESVAKSSEYVDAYSVALRDIQEVIANVYSPEENEDMNDLFCHLDHMIADLSDVYDILQDRASQARP